MTPTWDKAIALITTLASALEAWVEIADAEDLRQSDQDALIEAEQFLQAAGQDHGYYFYAISGRLCWDDEDVTLVTLVIKADDRQAALDEYRDQMMTINGLSTSELEHLERNGEGLFVNSIVRSVSPIVEV